MTYVMSDLHGRYDLFREMLETVHFASGDALYILGDVVDRNRGGIKILKDVMANPAMHLLLGNHEYMMRRTLTDPQKHTLNGKEDNLALWYRNGGQVTHEEFDAEDRETQKRILSFLDQLPLNLRLNMNETSWQFCHASPVEMYRIYGLFYPNETAFAVWSRIEGWMKVRVSADELVCGHTPTGFYRDVFPMEVCMLRENVWDIDCGCAAGEKRGGRLACLRLEDRKVLYSGTTEKEKGGNPL